MNYKLSIITVTLNSEHCIKNAIDSVAAVKNKRIEYIVIDGGSTDRTVDIISSDSSCVDYWVSENDSGIYDAINKGIVAAKGEWVYVLGSDDVILPEFSNIFNSLEDVNSIYYGDVELKSTKKIFGGKYNAVKLIYRNIPHQAIFYPKVLFSRYAYSLKYKLLADYALNLEIYGKKEFNFKYIPCLVARYNDESGLSSKCIDQEFGRDKVLIIKKNYLIIYPLYYLLLKIRNFFVNS